MTHSSHFLWFCNYPTANVRKNSAHCQVSDLTGRLNPCISNLQSALHSQFTTIPSSSLKNGPNLNPLPFRPPPSNSVIVPLPPSFSKWLKSSPLSSFRLFNIPYLIFILIALQNLRKHLMFV